MKLSTWRSSFKAWLISQIQIDSWVTDRPEDGVTTVGFLPPLRDVSYVPKDHIKTVGQATQDFFVTKRYPATLTYDQLPLGELEGIHSTLSLRMSHDLMDIAPLIALELRGLSQPIGVREFSKNDEWLIDLHWAIEIQWDAEPDQGRVQPIYLVDTVNIGIHREALDGLTSVLDTTITDLTS
jgi:hypothetical protein